MKLAETLLITHPQVSIRLECREEGHYKYWSVWKTADAVQVSWGRIGNAPSVQSVTLDVAIKRLNEKLKKGYAFVEARDHLYHLIEG